MATPIVKYSHNAHEQEVPTGRYVVGPDGRLVYLNIAVEMKAGWRYATQEDIDAAEAKARAL